MTIFRYVPRNVYSRFHNSICTLTHTSGNNINNAHSEDVFAGEEAGKPGVVEAVSSKPGNHDTLQNKHSNNSNDT